MHIFWDKGQPCVINTDLYKIKYLLTLVCYIITLTLKCWDSLAKRCQVVWTGLNIHSSRNPVFKKDFLKTVFKKASVGICWEKKYVHWPLCWSEPNNLISRQPYSSQENSRQRWQNTYIIMETELSMPNKHQLSVSSCLEKPQDKTKSMSRFLSHAYPIYQRETRE